MKKYLSRPVILFPFAAALSPSAIAAVTPVPYVVPAVIEDRQDMQIPDRFFTLLTTLMLAPLAMLGAIDGAALKKTQIAGPSLEAAVLYVPKNVDSAINWGYKDFSKDFQEATGKTLKTSPVLAVNNFDQPNNHTP